MEKFQACLIAESSGVLQVIGPNGQIEMYRQRGIGSIPVEHRTALRGMGLLNGNIMNYPEFPKNYTLYVEDKNIQGNVTITYPYKRYLRNLL